MDFIWSKEYERIVRQCVEGSLMEESKRFMELNLVQADVFDDSAVNKELSFVKKILSQNIKSNLGLKTNHLRL